MITTPFIETSADNMAVLWTDHHVITLAIQAQKSRTARAAFLATVPPDLRGFAALHYDRSARLAKKRQAVNADEKVRKATLKSVVKKIRESGVRFDPSSMPDPIRESQGALYGHINFCGETLSAGGGWLNFDAWTRISPEDFVPFDKDECWGSTPDLLFHLGLISESHCDVISSHEYQTLANIISQVLAEESQKAWNREIKGCINYFSFFSNMWYQRPPSANHYKVDHPMYVDILANVADKVNKNQRLSRLERIRAGARILRRKIKTMRGECEHTDEVLNPALDWGFAVAKHALCR